MCALTGLLDEGRVKVMNEGIVLIIVLVSALLFLAGVAFFLQKRKTPLLGLGDEQEVFPPGARGPGLWRLRIFVFLLIAITLMAFLTKTLALLWLVFGMLVVAYVLGTVGRYLYFFRHGSKEKKQEKDHNHDQDEFKGN